MLQDPIAKPPDMQQMEAARAGSDRRNKPNNGNPEQVLKCPRCDSLNTKFCYYNNYSLTQPRHFCKNCRRYWTQGGSLRNVPIGGGCRKNKRVKQRTVDPHVFGGLDDHSGPGSFLHAGAAAGSLLSSTCFGPPGSNTVPGFSDLLPSNDSHLLSMAFSRLQESLRLGEHAGTPASALAAPNPAKFSFLHSSPLYDPSLLPCPNGNVKPEHAYNGSELGNLFDPSSTSHITSAAASLPTLEEQLTNFEAPVDHAFNTSSLEAHLKLQHQNQLALHLGAASDQQMNGSRNTASNGNGGSSGMEIGRLHPNAHMLLHHRPHAALPGFEEHESPESMGGGMQQMMRRSAGTAAAMSTGSSMGIQEHWQPGDHHHEARNNRMQSAMGQLQLAGGAGEMHLHHAHRSAYHEPVSSSAAADQQMISFWSPSPWNDHVHATTSAGALL